MRVESLHLEVDPLTQFRMQPCQFIRSDILGPLKALDQFLSEGVLISDISCTHASPLVMVHKERCNSNGGGLSGGLVPLCISQPTSSPRYIVPAARRSAKLCQSG